MLDLQQGLGRNHPCSFSPAYQSNSSFASEKATDFYFWNEERMKHSENYDDLGGCTIGFQKEIDHDCIAYTSPLWPARTSKNMKCEASPLLPYNHHYSCPSPTPQIKAIADGRKKLMEIIQNMPESSYELSLKDIVDNPQSNQGVQQDVVIEDRSLNSKTEIKIKQNKKKKNSNRKQIPRSESMDSGVFLLKMFFPASLALKKKSMARNCSKVSPRPSFEGSGKPVDRQWWKMRFLVAGEKKNSRSSINRSTTSSEIRNAESTFTPSCWSFNSKKMQIKRTNWVPFLKGNSLSKWIESAKACA